MHLSILTILYNLKEKYYIAFCDWFLSSSINFSRFIYVVVRISILLLLFGVIFLSHWLMVIWVVSTFWPLWIMLWNIHVLAMFKTIVKNFEFSSSELLTFCCEQWCETMSISGGRPLASPATRIIGGEPGAKPYIDDLLLGWVS